MDIVRIYDGESYVCMYLQMLFKSLRVENYVWSQRFEAKLTVRREGGIVTTVTELRSDPFEIETHTAILFAKLDGTLAICANVLAVVFLSRESNPRIVRPVGSNRSIVRPIA